MQKEEVREFSVAKVYTAVSDTTQIGKFNLVAILRLITALFRLADRHL